METIKVIGAGLAGCEAAWQLAQRGFSVALYEMKPSAMTPAHHSPDFAELVCSNSFRGDRLENAVGLLKEELRRAGSLILTCAEATRVEAGGCLAVDRYGFSGLVTEKIRNHPNITVYLRRSDRGPGAAGDHRDGAADQSDALADAITAYFGQRRVSELLRRSCAAWSRRRALIWTQAWLASRYDRGTADYINCALTGGGIPAICAGAGQRRGSAGPRL